MAIAGAILQEIVKFGKSRHHRKILPPVQAQEMTLRKLVRYAKMTDFGMEYDFQRILRTRNIKKYYHNNVPVFDYDSLYEKWWHRTIDGEENVTWPNRIKYFALTSGTSGSASKRVPVSQQMIRQIRKTSLRQILSIPDFNMKPDFYQKSLMGIGGSTDLVRTNAGWEGDLSGIIQSRLPVWFHRFYKPGKKISSIKDWNDKLDAIAAEAHNWDIGILCGVPAWTQLMIERILEKNKVSSIHDVWPNFHIYVHGGVSFAPYAQSFKSLLGENMHYLDSYLASEGFVAIQGAQHKLGMQMVLDNGIYYEFVHFNENNFDAEGRIKANPEILTLEEVEAGKDYAILMSTCAGAWRYMIGDIIRFLSLDTYEIAVTGRTKLFLSLCGEHLSMDNMTMALAKTCQELGIAVNEFTVAGMTHEGLFAHKWYLGSHQEINTDAVRHLLDRNLCALNDDYTTERKHALKEVFVESYPLSYFYEFMEKRGKIGGQHKFPRVIKGQMNTDWEAFLKLKQPSVVRI
ncbi:MAG: GH3 auxin-responsive promoter family protein [Flavobacteriales bacterium]